MSEGRRFVDIINALLHEDEEELRELICHVTHEELNVSMFRAIMLTDKAEILHIILDAGANVDRQDKEGRTALFMAVKYQQLDMIQMLVKRHCNVNLGKYNQSSALHLASKRGSADMMRLLVDAGHEIDVVNWGGNTALLIACRFGHTEAVNVLVAAGANVNICNKLGHYPLHYAAFAGDGNLVASLLSNGARSDVRTHLGISPIMLACERKYCSVVEILASKSDLHHREQLYGGTVLHWAVASGCLLCVEFLLTHGASLTIPDHSGRTPVMEAVQSNHPHILKYLLDQHGGDPDSFLPFGANGGILHLAAHLNRIECCRKICQHPLTEHLVNQRDYFSTTPLDFGLIVGQKEIVTFLLQHGSMKSTILPELEELIHETVLGAGVDFTSTSSLRCSSSSSTSDVEIPLTGGLSEISQMLDRNTSAQRVSPPGLGSEFSDILRRLQAELDDTERTSVSHHVTHPRDQPKAEENAVKGETKAAVADCAKEDTVVDALVNKCLALAKERRAVHPTDTKIFKTYSAVKMAMIDMLRSAPGQQMVASVKFDFNTWLDNGPEAFVLKVTSLDLTDWLHQRMHTPWSLRELCRGCIRRALGYRAADKVDLLPAPAAMKQFLNMKELEDLQTSDINIRGTGAFDEIDVE